MRMLVGMHTLAQRVETAAIGAFDLPLGTEVEEDLGMTQRSASAIAGDAVGIDGDGLERLGHALTPYFPTTAVASISTNRPGLARALIATRVEATTEPLIVLASALVTVSISRMSVT